MESVVGRAMLQSNFENKRVLVTGHTGFKGAWLTRWLLHLGAEVAGNGPATTTFPSGVRSLFDELNLAPRIAHHEGDLSELDKLAAVMAGFQPEFVFHLAAQSLVRVSYDVPVETFRSNLLGTVHVLESLRRVARPVIAVMVTSDKCYENFETTTGYAEEDRLGGHDPYSASKAMCELATSSYRQSFFGSGPICVASARAGNVIGGGDWATDRILPDAVRALRQGEAIVVRNAAAIRPWQHVLEPLGGYLQLAAAMTQDPHTFCSPFNFGPASESVRSVGDLVSQVLQDWPGQVQSTPTGQAQAGQAEPHETQRLVLNTSKARQLLGWCGRWDFQQTVAETVDWYCRHQAGESPEQLTLAQIERYSASPMCMPQL